MESDGGRDREPDYRMSLAAERTYLAYVRTGLAFAAAGVAVAGALPNAGAIGVRRALGIALVTLSAVIFGFARFRLIAITRAMRQGRPLPPVQLGSVLTVALLAMALTAAVVVVLA